MSRNEINERIFIHAQKQYSIPVEMPRVNRMNGRRRDYRK